MSMKRGTFVHIQTLGPRTPELPEARCPVTGKRSFRTELEALELASYWAHINSSEYGYAYPCEHCGDYHLTRLKES